MPPNVPTPRRELLGAGATVAALDLDLRSGRSVSVFRGVHVGAGHDIGLLTRVRAALRTQGALSVATFTTAAVLHAFRWLPSAWGDPHTTIHIAVLQADARRHRDGLRLHRRLIEPQDVTAVHGIRCFTPARTLVEIARSPHVPRLLAVQILDGALRDGRVTKAQLEACLARFPGERGIARARERVRLSRERVDSPQETQMRLLLHQGALPDIDVGIEICDEEGLVLARGDLGYRRYLIWGEYDGYDVHAKRKVFRSDRVGDRWLQRRGWHVTRFVDEDFGRPDAVCREWKQAIADAPARIAALPASRSPELAAARIALRLD
jgi:hypothetical protein